MLAISWLALQIRFGLSWHITKVSTPANNFLQTLLMTDPDAAVFYEHLVSELVFLLLLSV